MEEKVTYYGFADNDYQFLKANVEEGRVSNAMCSMAQNTCERYLKALIEEIATLQHDTEIMKTHSLKRLKSFIQKNIPDFSCDWKTVVQADGYYFSARYPGDDSYYVTKSDVDDCWEAVKETKYAVDKYRESHVQEKVKQKEAFEQFKNKFIQGMD